jgi:hypothetical protein
MKRAVRAVALTLPLLIAAVALAAPPQVGQIVTIKTQASPDRFSPALVTKVISGDTVNVVALLEANDDWPAPSYASPSHPAWLYINVAKGTGVGEWQENTAGVGPQGPTGATGATGSTGATGATGPGAVVLSQSTPTLTIGGSAVQFSTTNDTIYTASIKILTTLSLSGGAAGHVDLLCDATATPSTIVQTVQSESTGTLTIGLNLQASNTLVVSWRVPAGHRCRLVSTNDTGTPTYTLPRQLLQTLG